MSDSEESDSSTLEVEDGALDLSLPVRKRAASEDDPENEANGQTSKNPKKSLIRRYCKFFIMINIYS